MAEYAEIVDGTVANIIIADSVFVAGLPGTYVDVDGLGVKIGALYDGTNFTPPSDPDPVLRTQLTRLEFRNQFTQAEKVALYTAKATNVSVEIFLDDLASAEFVELTDPATVAAVQFLETATIIASGRGAEILTGI